MFDLSIITVTRNDKKGLISTMQSILPLPSNFEWIIVDGNSSDGSLDVLKDLPKDINIKWVSEPDKGIYDAMNKGVMLSRGLYLNFMNSGDCFIQNSFDKLNSAGFFDDDIIVCNCKTISHNHKPAYVRKYPDNLNELEKWACIQHQSTFLSKKVFDKIGLYSLEYDYLADYEHFIKAYLSKAISFKLCPNIKIALFYVDGVSTNPKTALKVAYEYKHIQMRYFNKYNKQLFISNYVKYVIGLLPLQDKIIYFFRKIFLTKR